MRPPLISWVWIDWGRLCLKSTTYYSALQAQTSPGIQTSRDAPFPAPQTPVEHQIEARVSVAHGGPQVLNQQWGPLAIHNAVASKPSNSQARAGGNNVKERLVPLRRYLGNWTFSENLRHVQIRLTYMYMYSHGYRLSPLLCVHVGYPVRRPQACEDCHVRNFIMIIVAFFPLHTSMWILHDPNAQASA